MIPKEGIYFQGNRDNDPMWGQVLSVGPEDVCVDLFLCVEAAEPSYTKFHSISYRRAAFTTMATQRSFTEITKEQHDCLSQLFPALVVKVDAGSQVPPHDGKE